MKSVCKFCRKFGQSIGRDHLSDYVLFESKNFVVIPSVGSIIPGWLLVLPRTHHLSVGSFDTRQMQEFIEIRAVATEALQDCFGSVSMFEHGAVRERESVGCGVDHAHLHIVATEIDLLAGSKTSSETRLQWRPVSGIQAAKSFVAEQMPYVFVESNVNGAWIGTASEIESQLFRKVIATDSGQPNHWDWKSHPFDNNVRETIERLEMWKASRTEMSATV